MWKELSACSRAACLKRRTGLVRRFLGFWECPPDFEPLRPRTGAVLLSGDRRVVREPLKFHFVRQASSGRQPEILQNVRLFSVSCGF
jgi:hypothetical protein